jgi:uncharacterized protein
MLNKIFTLGWAIMCGAGAQELGIPLPWVLGPMFGIGFFSFAELAGRLPSVGRKAGQITIGVALGLYFTQSVISEVSQLAGWMILGAIFSLLLTVLAARFFQQFAGVSGTTAMYCSAIGAASDMATQAQKAGADGAAVASSHAVRVMIVVTVIPLIASFMGAEGVNAVLAAKSQVLIIEREPLALVVGGGIVLAWIGGRLGLPNPWVLAPLAVAAVYAAMGNDTRLPDAVVNGGSLLIGWNLGQYMTREFFKNSPRVVLAAAIMTVGMLVVSLGFAALISDWVGLPLVSAIVATSPGGIAEMAITAKVLGLGAPVVTAFHFIRLLAVIIFIKPLSDWLIKRGWLRVSFT